MAKVLRDLIIAAASKPREFPFASLKEAIRLRQQIYGERTQILKTEKTNKIDLAGIKAEREIEVRIVDKDGLPIAFNAKDFKEKREAGMFEPCTLIVQPKAQGFASMINAALAEEASQGTLQSQKEESAAMASYRAPDVPESSKLPTSGLGSMPHDPTPNAMEIFKRGMKKD